MRIELWRKMIGTDYCVTCCAVCGDDLDRGNVYPVAVTDKGAEMGEMCVECLDYLNRRKDAGGWRMRINWPSRDWPTVENLEEARRRYPEPMFPDNAAYDAAATDNDTEEEYIQASFIWKTEREVAAELD